MIDLNRLQQEPGLVQCVKSEPALLVKEEILMDSSQDRQPSDKGTPPQQRALYECDKCPKVFKSYACFNVHKKYVHSIEIHKLAQSNEKLKYASLNAHSNDQHECDVCKKMYKTHHDLDMHYSMLHGARSAAVGKEQQCVQGTTTPAGTGRVNEDCSTSLRDFLDVKHELEGMDIGPTMLQHMDIHYTINKNMIAGTGENTIVDDGNEAMPCSDVKTESLGDKLREHKKLYVRNNNTSVTTGSAVPSPTHAGEKPYKCITCDARFAVRTTFIKHLRVHTSEKPYQCTTCDARFAQSCNLTQHMRVHTGERSYQCTTCDARFSSSGNLTQHMRVHTGERAYQCTTCDARFAVSSSFIKHMRVHTGERPFKCTMCGARFSQSVALSHHMRVHTGEKPYQCTTCDAKFAHSGTFSKHMRVHTGEKECNECGTKFTWKCDLNKHMRRIHPK